MISPNITKRTVIVALTVCASFLVTMPARGQTPPAQPGEIKAVVRISKELIEDVMSRKEIVVTVPFEAKVLGFCCKGVADGRATVSVDVVASQGEANVIVYGKGEALTYVRGTCGLIVATAPACIPVAIRAVVRFDGKSFSLVEMTPWAEVHADLDCVEGRYGSRVGRCIGSLARPAGKLLLPRAEDEAKPIAEWYVKNVAIQVAEEILAKLNRITAVETSLNRVFPQTKDWDIQVSADAKFVQATYGPRGGAAPT